MADAAPSPAEAMSANMEDTMQEAAQAHSFTHDGFIFLGIGIAITLLRTYARWDMVGFKRFQADDYLVWLALVLYGTETATNYFFVQTSHGLANNDMTPEERAALDPNSSEFYMRETGSKANFAGWPQYALLMWSLKAAMCVYYLRLMERSTYRNRILVGFGMILSTFVVVIIVMFVSCTPITKWWQMNPDPGPLCYSVSSPAVLWTFLACNIITDLYIIWLPMPMLFKSTLPMPTKIALATLFGCGIFVTIAGILRVAYIVFSPRDLRHISFWAVRETFVGIVTTNLPCIFVLARRWLSPFFSFLRSGNFSSSGKSKLSKPSRLSRPRGVWAGQSQVAHTTHRSPMPTTTPGPRDFQMDGMGTFAMAERSSSQERIVQKPPEGDEGGFSSRLGRKVSLKRIRARREPRSLEDNLVEHEGIQKVVDITIVEEHMHATTDEISDEEAGRTTKSFDFPEPSEVYNKR